jgi:hypothetical protein
MADGEEADQVLDAALQGRAYRFKINSTNQDLLL